MVEREWEGRRELTGNKLEIFPTGISSRWRLCLQSLTQSAALTQESQEREERSKTINMALIFTTDQANALCLAVFLSVQYCPVLVRPPSIRLFWPS